MKGYRFYLEYGSKTNRRKGIHEGNVVALVDVLGDGFRPLPGYMANGGTYECVAAVYDHPNSAVCGTSITHEYLSDTCKRIPERIARQIHPRLFDTLEQWERSAQA